ncbi:MAG: hypothetical protein ACREGR_02925 [Minisyncoccia bacterium]
MRPLAVLPFLLLLIPGYAFAQAKAATPALISCSTIYPADKITITFDHPPATATPGETLSLSGTLTNNGTLPLEGALLYIKLYRETVPLNAPPGAAIYFEKVGSGITLAVGKSAPVSISLPLASDLPAGTYHVEAVLIPAQGFDPNGALILESTVVNGTLDFRIASSPASGAVTLLPSAALRTFSSSTPSIVTLTAQAVNTTKTAFSGSLTWTLYAADASDPTQPLSTSESAVSIPAGGTAPVSYMLTDTAHSLYYVVGSITTSGGAQSLAGFVLARPGTASVRIWHAGALQTPLVSGSPAAYACVQSLGGAQPFNVTVSANPVGFLSFLGSAAFASYTGAPLPAPGVLIAFANRDTSSFNVVAHLYVNGALVDSATIPYRCGTDYPCDYTVLIVSVAALLALVLLIFVLIRSRRRAPPAITPPAPTL